MLLFLLVFLAIVRLEYGVSELRARSIVSLQTISPECTEEKHGELMTYDGTLLCCWMFEGGTYGWVIVGLGDER